MGRVLSLEEIAKHLKTKASPVKGICCVFKCPSPLRVAKGKLIGKLCPWHREELRKKTNPAGFFYNRVRQHAKKRKIPFLISKPQWEAWCLQVGYHNRCGEYGERPSVDRIKSNLPYTIGNIQMLTFRENVAKGNSEREDSRGWRYGPGGRKIVTATAQIITPENEEEKLLERI